MLKYYLFYSLINLFHFVFVGLLTCLHHAHLFHFSSKRSLAYSLIGELHSNSTGVYRALMENGNWSKPCMKINFDGGEYTEQKKKKTKQISFLNKGLHWFFSVSVHAVFLFFFFFFFREEREGGMLLLAALNSGSESTQWLFSTQPSVKLIRECIMPLIKSMALATPNWWLLSKLTQSMENFSFTYKTKRRWRNYLPNGPNCSLGSGIDISEERKSLSGKKNNMECGGTDPWCVLGGNYWCYIKLGV